MGFWSDFGNWLGEGMLRSILGPLWPEIVSIILIVLAAIFVTIFIVICVKYHNLKKCNDTCVEELTEYKLKRDRLKAELNDLKTQHSITCDQLENEKKAKLNAQKDMDKLKAENKKLQETINEQKEKEEKLLEIEKAKKSESAKKAAETRKKNKQNKDINEEK